MKAQPESAPDADAVEAEKTAVPAPLLELADLEYVYANPQGPSLKVRLQGQLKLCPHEVLALTGASGSGKSTLLECIGLLRHPFSAAHFRLGDDDVLAGLKDAGWCAHLRASRLGFMPQTGGLLPYLTVAENCNLQRRLAGLPARSLKEIAAEPYVQALMIGERLKRYPHELSAGERQRAVFCRAVEHHPDLVLADEPTSALDPALAGRMFDSILKVAADCELAVLMVTHDVDLVAKFGIRSFCHISAAGSAAGSLSVFAETDGADRRQHASVPDGAPNLMKSESDGAGDGNADPETCG